MRITGGKSAHRILAVPKRFDIRPTTDRVKQAVFNSLGRRIINTHVLELFAGTGALSLEALSRGCRTATCIEKSAHHAQYIRCNADNVGVGSEVLRIHIQDVFTALEQLSATGHRFDIVLADPPYGTKNMQRRSTSLAQKLIDDKYLPSMIAPHGLLVVGHAKYDTLEISALWRESRLLTHGDNIIRILEVYPS
ncbi:MAG TPA: RsmD family RNA methyltransferase [Chthoniobacterales bacterium]|nr:RsmD family RNA methyltransferase [Chthoniobacterales bacterium]